MAAWGDKRAWLTERIQGDKHRVDMPYCMHAINLLCAHIYRCASELVQRKLFSESPDRFGLVQFGTERAVNPLDYPHVALMERGLAVADWQVGT